MATNTFVGVLLDYRNLIETPMARGESLRAGAAS